MDTDALPRLVAYCVRVIHSLLTLMRPKQWIKNILVVAAPLAAGRLLERNVLLDTLLALLAFCLASASTYCLNDALDAAEDALHPTKRFRPVASGRLPRWAAFAMAGALAALALAVSHVPALRLVVLIYLVTTVAYSSFLKHQPVIELALISAGFVLRAIAGGAATGVPLSQWFLIVAGFGSLLMVGGKRLSELTRATATGSPIRRSLAHYPASYLRTVMGMSLAVTTAVYCLWASEVADTSSSPTWVIASTFPFVIALLQYALDADRGQVEEPEVAVLRDPTLLLLALAWVGTYAMGVLR